jgi:SAM-dependent methyltransferase
MVDYNALAKDYQQHRHVHPEVLKTLIKTIEETHASKVLEIGCGTGNYVITLHTATKVHAWGINPSEEMLKQASQKFPQINFRKGQAEALPYEDNFFDFVFSVDLVHHLDDVVPYFSEIMRVLKPAGQICTVTDSEDIIRNRRPLAFYFPDTITVDLQRYPSILVLRRRMQDAGFQKIRQAQVEYSFQLTDIQPYKDKAFSCLHLISPEAHQQGIARLENDLTQGTIPANSRYLLLFGTKPKRIVYV